MCNKAGEFFADFLRLVYGGYGQFMDRSLDFTRPNDIFSHFSYWFGQNNGPLFQEELLRSEFLEALCSSPPLSPPLLS